MPKFKPGDIIINPYTKEVALVLEVKDKLYCEYILNIHGKYPYSLGFIESYYVLVTDIFRDFFSVQGLSDTSQKDS